MTISNLSRNTTIPVELNILPTPTDPIEGYYNQFKTVNYSVDIDPDDYNREKALLKANQKAQQRNQLLPAYRKARKIKNRLQSKARKNSRG